MNRSEFKKLLKKTWHFIWEEDSLLSWIVNIILAFILIKFIVYPGLGFVLGTTHPIVAVVSGSMEHNQNFDDWWYANEAWYTDKGITKDDFQSFIFKNGFNRGDIMILKGRDASKIEEGEVIVFISSRDRPRADPIIHRVVKIDKTGQGALYFQTKGDNNPSSINLCDQDGCLHELDIRSQQVIGNAIFRIPFLGYIKIWFVELIQLFMR
ncbi:MAG: signal peptidase I [Nanoarchaeota archaeon]